MAKKIKSLVKKRKKMAKKTAFKAKTVKKSPLKRPLKRHRVSSKKTKKAVKMATFAGSHILVKVFGVGGGGGNAIDRMNEYSSFRSMDLVGVNTDSQELEKCHVKKKIHIGKNLTRGRGTGMNPELGRQAAEENRSEIVEAMKGADLVFISAGLGGGTGSGATPIVADAAREAGALTIAIVTKPFVFEGAQRAKIAEDSLNQIRERVDAFIVVPNDRVFNVIKKDTPTGKAFERIDDILREAIVGITELISSQGLINVDFSDIQTIMREAGPTLIGVGIASGQNRAVSAASQAVNSPLLEFSIEGAQGILFGISGGRDMKMSEIHEIAKTITATIDPSAKIIFGAYYDRRLKKGQIKVTLIATGFSGTVTKADMDEMLPVSGLFSDMEIDKSEAEVEVKTQPKNEINQPVESKKMKNIFEKVPSQKVGKKTVGTSKKTVDDGSSAEEKAKSDIWEIPAFLRKKRR